MQSENLSKSEYKLKSKRRAGSMFFKGENRKEKHVGPTRFSTSKFPTITKEFHVTKAMPLCALLHLSHLNKFCEWQGNKQSIQTGFNWTSNYLS